MPTFTLSRRQALVAVVCALGVVLAASQLLPRPARSRPGPTAARSWRHRRRPTPRGGEARRRRRGCGSAARASTGCARAPGSPTRSRAPAARRVAPTRCSSTSRRRSRTASRCSFRDARPGGCCVRRRRCVGGRAGRPQLGDGRAARRAARRGPGHGAEDRRLPPRARPVYVGRPARRDLGHRARRGSTTCEGSWCRDLDARPSPHACRPRSASALPRERDACSAIGLVCSLAAAGAVVACRSRGWPARLRRACCSSRSAGGGEAQRLDALDRSPLSAEIDRAGRARRGRDGATHAAPLRHPRSGPSPAIRPASRSTSGSSSSCRWAGRLRRARSSRCSPSFGVHAAPTTGSTSVRGCAATASTSCSRSTSGGCSAGAAASAASRTTYAGGWRSAIAPGLAGERRAVLEGIVLGDDDGADRRRCARTSAPRASTTCWPSRAERDPGRGRRSSLLAWLAGVSRWLGELGALAGDRGVRARGRRAAVGRARGDRRIARLDRLDGGPAAGCVVRAAPRRGRTARVEPVSRLRRRASSSRSLRSRRSSPSSPRLSRRARGVSDAALRADGRRRLDRVRRS